MVLGRVWGDLLRRDGKGYGATGMWMGGVGCGLKFGKNMELGWVRMGVR